MKRGRPRGSKKAPQSQAIGIRLATSEIQQLKAIAESEGVTLNFVNRSAIKYYLASRGAFFLSKGQQKTPELA